MYSKAGSTMRSMHVDIARLAVAHLYAAPNSWAKQNTKQKSARNLQVYVLTHRTHWFLVSHLIARQCYNCSCCIDDSISDASRREWCRLLASLDLTHGVAAPNTVVAIQCVRCRCRWVVEFLLLFSTYIRIGLILIKLSYITTPTDTRQNWRAPASATSRRCACSTHLTPLYVTTSLCSSMTVDAKFVLSLYSR